MGFVWSHTTYAIWHDIIFNFEDKWDLDYFLDHTTDAKRISAADAWKTHKNFVRVYSSRRIGSNNARRQIVKEWKNEINCGRVRKTCSRNGRT